METHECQNISYKWEVDYSSSNSPTFGNKSCDLQLQLSLIRNRFCRVDHYSVCLHSINNIKYEGLVKCWFQGDLNDGNFSNFELPIIGPNLHLKTHKVGLERKINLIDGKLIIYCEIRGKCVQFSMDSYCKLANDFGAFLGTKEMADVDIITGDGQKIPAHKLVLSARSKVFAAMFKHPMKESAENCVTISDMSQDVLMEMLRYMYTGKSSNLKEINVDLIAAADKYELEGLKMMCGKIMTDNLSIETAAEALKTADLYNMDALKINTIQFIKSNIAKVHETSNWKKLVTTDRLLILESFIDPIFLKI